MGSLGHAYNGKDKYPREKKEIVPDPEKRKPDTPMTCISSY
jgi:hypothetical protein